MTYLQVLLLAIDRFGAAVIYQQLNLTISAMTWMVETGRAGPLKLWKWQAVSLTYIGPWLDKIQPSHREMARANDLKRAQAIVGCLK